MSKPKPHGAQFLQFGLATTAQLHEGVSSFLCAAVSRVASNDCAVAMRVYRVVFAFITTVVIEQHRLTYRRPQAHDIRSKTVPSTTTWSHLRTCTVFHFDTILARITCHRTAVEQT